LSIECALQTPPCPWQPRERAERAKPVSRTPANDPAVQRRDQRDEDRQRKREFATAREQKRAGGENKEVGDRKCSGLLRKCERKFPDENDGRVYENGKRSVLELAGKIAANPRVRTQQRKMTFAPTAGDVREHRQDRQFIVIVPKNERIVPKKKETETDDE